MKSDPGFSRPGHEGDPATCAHAPHAYHLAGDVEQFEPVEHVAPVIGERAAVVLDQALHLVHAVSRLLEVHEQRRVIEESPPAVDDVGQFGDGP